MYLKNSSRHSCAPFVPERRHALLSCNDAYTLWLRGPSRLLIRGRGGLSSNGTVMDTCSKDWPRAFSRYSRSETGQQFREGIHCNERANVAVFDSKKFGSTRWNFGQTRDLKAQLKRYSKAFWVHSFFSHYQKCLGAYKKLLYIIATECRTGGRNDQGCALCRRLLR